MCPLNLNFAALVNSDRTRNSVKSLAFNWRFKTFLSNIPYSAIADALQKLVRQLLSANFADFKAAISNCINTANTDKQEKLDSLLSLNFQTFQKVQFLTV
ncbi:hypothetical protein [Nostoc sp.]|uniref:hypothetical protein n=1 Tax=Nostoc sp. TaxID=1180 RepID=UPI002FF4E1C1